jgi:transcriptional regulator with XRE-family HTH domain
LSKKELNLQTLTALLVRIRSAKHLAQSDTTSSICTQGMLSKIEAGKSSPSFLIVISLLSKMNISLTEFEHLYLHDLKTKKDTVRASVDDVIENYHFFIFQQHKRIISFHPHPPLFLHWLHFTFGIDFRTKATPKVNPKRTEDLLNQDEFFFADYYPLVYHLTFLSLEAALYNYQRLLDQMNRHQLATHHELITIDATITLAVVFYTNDDVDNAYHYFYLALKQATREENISRMIVCQITLSILAEDRTMLAHAKSLAQLFSKDIFFDYWYNVLYTKFKEVHL